MTPIRTRITRAIEDGDTWLIVILISALMVVILSAAIIYHYDMRANTTAIDRLNAALGANTDFGRKRDEKVERVISQLERLIEERSELGK